MVKFSTLLRNAILACGTNDTKVQSLVSAAKANDTETLSALLACDENAAIVANAMMPIVLKSNKYALIRALAKHGVGIAAETLMAAINNDHWQSMTQLLELNAATSNVAITLDMLKCAQMKNQRIATMLIDAGGVVDVEFVTDLATKRTSRDCYVLDHLIRSTNHTQVVQNALIAAITNNATQLVRILIRRNVAVGVDALNAINEQTNKDIVDLLTPCDDDESVLIQAKMMYAISTKNVAAVEELVQQNCIVTEAMLYMAIASHNLGIIRLIVNNSASVTSDMLSIAVACDCSHNVLSEMITADAQRQQRIFQPHDIKKALRLAKIKNAYKSVSVLNRACVSK